MSKWKSKKKTSLFCKLNKKKLKVFFLCMSACIFAYIYQQHMVQCHDSAMENKTRGAENQTKKQVVF